MRKKQMILVAGGWYKWYTYYTGYDIRILIYPTTERIQISSSEISDELIA